MSEGEMAGWHYQYNEHELGQTLGDGEGQGSLGYCSPLRHKELDMTGQLNKNNQENYVNGSYTNIYNISHQQYMHQTMRYHLLFTMMSRMKKEDISKC